MARHSTHTRGKRNKASQAREGWRNVTWDDLARWTDRRSVARGEAYQRQGRVAELVLADDGQLLATVIGSEPYLTSARLVAGKGRRKRIESTCTCPVGMGCKHAVAVMIEFLATLADEQEVASAEPDDPRWAVILGERAVLDELDLENDRADPSSRARQGRKRRTRAAQDESIRLHIRQQSQTELAALVWSFVERFPQLRAELRERIALAEGDAGSLVASARRELRAVAKEVGWRNSWTGEGYTPDYSRLKLRLERLVEMGRSDDVVQLGRELIVRGMEQVGQSQDEGETAMALAECLPIVFEALAGSSLAPVEKILYAIDAYLDDDYDLIGDAAGKVLSAQWSTSDWSMVADKLAGRLMAVARETELNEHARSYRRSQISDWLLDALEHAGRDDEVWAVCESEARANNSYRRLVDRLLAHKRYGEAEQWAGEGIAKTHQQWPGIAAELARSLAESARRRKQWKVVAAYAAARFLDSPSCHSFDELDADAKKARCREPVRAAALRFLETGEPPIRLQPQGKDRWEVKVDATWPLPVPEPLVPLMAHARSHPHPRYDVLLEMAIGEKRPDDVLRWYDAMMAERESRGTGLGYFAPEEVAAAVASTHPERALDIYRSKLNANLPRTGMRAYETCADCLRRMRVIYESLDQEDYWNELVDDIRHKYGNRPRFMEVLDRMQGRTVLQSKRARRR